MTHEYNFEWLLFSHQKYLRKAGKQEKKQSKDVPEFLLSLEIIKILSREVFASHSARNGPARGRRARLWLRIGSRIRAAGPCNPTRIERCEVKNTSPSHAWDPRPDECR